MRSTSRGKKKGGKRYQQGEWGAPGERCEKIRENMDRKKCKFHTKRKMNR